jgi:signal transduction histidine kinase
VIDWKARYQALHEELVALVHAVAHDLRAPLRAADGFSRALVTRESGGVDDEARDYLRRIREATAAMSRQIEAMTRLARVTSAELRPRILDLAAVAAEVLAALRAEEPGREVATEVAAGLHVKADAYLARVLLRCLLDNAWRATRREPRPRVELGVRQEGAETVYFVRDNGEGFDPAEARQLFQPFGRVRVDEEDAGAGMGLAVSLYIVHRHGGRLWAASAPGQGATFSFTLGEPDG